MFLIDSLSSSLFIVKTVPFLIWFSLEDVGLIFVFNKFTLLNALNLI